MLDIPKNQLQSLFDKEQLRKVFKDFCLVVAESQFEAKDICCYVKTHEFEERPFMFMTEAELMFVEWAIGEQDMSKFQCVLAIDSKLVRQHQAITKIEKRILLDRDKEIVEMNRHEKKEK